MMSPAPPTAFAGGRYRVQRVLGEGAEKRVYVAHDILLDRDVALAVLRTEELDETRLARIRREARAMARLGDHPHIVTVHDFGEEQGQVYVVSQYMAGGSVETLLQKAESHRLPVEEALRLADQICRALEHAHAHGVVHRDLKPSNIWLTRDGTAKLGDFGLAAIGDLTRLTAEGMMVGTVVFMPPEQAMGRPPDARSDLYALGVMLYEMVTGRAPFLGDDVLAIISQHINTPPVAPSWHNPEVPPALEALILRLLAKAPEDRPESAAAVREVLTAIGSEAATPAVWAPGREANPLDRLAGGAFVGRERELSELRAGLEDALSGRGRLLLLAGEPGIGKTRTAEELVTYARLRRAQALWGRCYEGEGAPAYWPWVQAIRSYVQDRDPDTLRAEMGPGATDIAQVVSVVRERLPGLLSPPTQEPEQARFRLFDSVTTFLRNAAKAQPIVLVLDDLHCADKASLLLLEFMASELGSARLLVVGTYRDVEVGRHHPLSQTLGELTRQHLSRRIFLRGLAAADVARFIELTAGVKPPAALVSAVHSETEGNPFFVAEVVRLLASEGRLDRPEGVRSRGVDIPQSIREVVGRRLDRLSSECNQVLATAAVMGREFRLDALERVSDLAGERLLDVLEEALAARVVIEMTGAPGRYSFSHALMRETLYGELSGTRRVRLHRRIADALEGLYQASPEPHLAELAYHFFQAALGSGDVGKAVDYARRAAGRAGQLLAHEEAANQYARALQALELKQPCDEAQRCELLLALADAQARAGDTANAKETFLRAAEAARGVGASQRLARAALGFSQIGPVHGHAPGVVDETLVHLLEEALDVLSPEDSTLRASLLGRLAVALYWSDAGARRESLIREAVAMAERLAEPATRAAVLGMRHTALWGPDNVEERLATATEVLRLAEEAGDPEAALEAHRWRLADLFELGDIAAVDREIEAYGRVARELRQPLHLSFAATFRGLRAFIAGRFAEAETFAQEALVVGQRLENQVKVALLPLRLWLYREQGRLDELKSVMGNIFEHAAAQPAVRCAQVRALCEFGMIDKARAEMARIAAHDFADLPRDFGWLPGMGALVEACVVLGDTRRAATLYQLLLPLADRCIVVATATTWHGPVSYYLGRLAATMGRHTEAAAHFEHALEMNEAMGARPFAAHTRHAYAAVLLARGERGRAIGLLNRALDTARELGMKPLVEQVLADKLRAQGVDPSELSASLHAVASAVQREQPDLRRHAAPDGRVTLVFTDIEGYAALIERLGDQRAHEVLRAHNAIVRQQVAAHGGFEVKSAGDGFMLAFESARRALFCAVGVQRAVAAHSAQHPAAAIRVRMGLHTGEPIKEADDFFGKAVVLAARIADEAKGGEILVSSLVKSLTEGTGEFVLDRGREAKFQGLAGTYRVFTVAW